MIRQGPITWDFQKERVKFDQGEWIDLQKEERSRKVRRVYVSQDTLLPGSGQTNVDVQVTHKDMHEKPQMGVLENERVSSLARVYTDRSLIPPRFTNIKVPVLNAAESSQILPKGTDLGVVEVAEPLENVLAPEEPTVMETDAQPSSVSEQKLTTDEQNVIAQMLENLPAELTSEQRAKVEALLIQHRGILSVSEHDIGRTQLVEHRIDTGDARPIRESLRVRLFSMLSLLRKKPSVCWSTVL